MTRALVFAVNPDADEGGPIYMMGRPLTVQVGEREREREREETEGGAREKEKEKEKDNIQFSEACTLDV